MATDTYKHAQNHRHGYAENGARVDTESNDRTDTEGITPPPQPGIVWRLTVDARPHVAACVRTASGVIVGTFNIWAVPRESFARLVTSGAAHVVVVRADDGEASTLGVALSLAQHRGGDLVLAHDAERGMLDGALSFEALADDADIRQDIAEGKTVRVIVMPASVD